VITKSRRTFLKASIMAALFAAVPGKNLFAQSKKSVDVVPNANPPLQTDILTNYTKASFQSYLNSIFEMETLQGTVPLELQQISDFSAPKGGESFALLFRGGSHQLRQKTYTLRHPSLGTFQIFLVPVGADQNGAQGYLATINRLSYADALKYSAPTKPWAARPVPIPVPTPTPAATPPATLGTTTSVPPTTAGPAPSPAPRAPKRRKKHRDRFMMLWR
jgi:uncharacterized protein DUF6916